MPDMVKDEAEAQKLRQRLHERIDQLPPSTLAAADRLLLKIEVEHLRQEIDSAFDKDQAESKLSAEKVSEAIALHRARHPYSG
jgi:hypothetical protein